MKNIASAIIKFTTRVSSNKAQIWVETVVYTLIGLSIIAVILALVTPKIQEVKDKTIIDQTLTLLDELNRNIDTIKFSPGNSWPIQLNFENGKFYVDGSTDEIYFLFEESHIRYSEIGEEIPRGRIRISTRSAGRNYQVKLSLNYSAILNITSNGIDKVQSFQPASLPYNLFIEHGGRDSKNRTIINVNA